MMLWLFLLFAVSTTAADDSGTQRVLCTFDGGGTRGIMEIAMVEVLELNVGAKVL